eukprot:scaffold2550_cov153-Skeletonema_menzelii.AAC.16
MVEACTICGAPPCISNDVYWRYNAAGRVRLHSPSVLTHTQKNKIRYSMLSTLEEWNVRG